MTITDSTKQATLPRPSSVMINGINHVIPKKELIEPHIDRLPTAIEQPVMLEVGLQEYIVRFYITYMRAKNFTN
jgi:hypothetical protein